MKKMKVAVVLLVLIIAGIAAYFYKTNLISFDEKASIPEAAIVEDLSFKSDEQLKVEEASKLNAPGEVEAQMKKWDEEYDRIEKEWNNLVLQLFTEELKLEKAQYDDYLKLRDGLSNDKIRAFEAFHKEMEEKFGENYTYNPSDEELAFERDIQNRYDQVLKEKIGEENFNKYLILRDNYNNTLIEKQNADEGVILMDF